jgi:MIP family channel proteins
MNIKKLIAEFLGTFTLVFIGAFAVAVLSNNANNGNVVVAALAHGIVLVGIIYAYGDISGAHFNPAVTAAMMVTGKQNITEGAMYMVVQFIGGIVAAFALVALVPNHGNFGATTGSLTSANILQAIVIEAILTFFLVSTIYQAAVYNRAGNLAPVAIGFTLVACILAGGVFTGASLNPARTLGPALASGDLSYVLPYLVGIFAGGITGGLVQSLLLAPDKK